MKKVIAEQETELEGLKIVEVQMEVIKMVMEQNNYDKLLSLLIICQNLKER